MGVFEKFKEELPMKETLDSSLKRIKTINK